MSLFNCSKCWDNPCTCGYNYKHMSTSTIESLIDALKKIIDERKDQRRGGNT